jgi:hypothetical protein
VGRGWVVVCGTQNLRQLVRTELARSTGAVGEGSEPDGFHELTINDIWDDPRHTTFEVD